MPSEPQFITTADANKELFRWARQCPLLDGVHNLFGNIRLTIQDGKVQSIVMEQSVRVDSFDVKPTA